MPVSDELVDRVLGVSPPPASGNRRSNPLPTRATGVSDNLIERALQQVDPETFGQNLARGITPQGDAFARFKDPATGAPRSHEVTGKFGQAALDAMDTATFGLPRPVEKVYGKTQPGRTTSKEPMQGFGDTLAYQVAPEIVGFVGGPQEAVSRVGGKILSTITGRGPELAAKLATRAAQSEKAASLTNRAIRSTIAAKAISEGAAGLAYSTAEGLVSGKSGEDLRDHVALGGATFAAFGALEIPIGIGFNLLAQKMRKPAAEVMADIAQESRRTGVHPAELLKSKVEANVTAEEVKKELSAAQYGEKVRRALLKPGAVDVVSKGNVMGGSQAAETRAAAETAGRAGAGPAAGGSPTQLSPATQPAPTPKPLAKSKRLQMLVESHAPATTTDDELRVLHRERLANQEPLAPTSDPVTPADIVKTLPAEHVSVPPPTRTKVDVPIKFGMASFERDAILQRTGKHTLDEVGRGELRKLAHLFSRETMDEYVRAVQNELTYTKSQMELVGKRLRRGTTKAGSPSDMRVELRERTKDLDSELAYLTKIATDARPGAAPALISEEVLSGRVPLIRTTPEPQITRPGIPEANVRDIRNEPIEPGRLYMIHYRTPDGIRVTTVNGAELQEVVRTGKLGKQSVINIPQIVPSSTGMTLHGGFVPLDPAQFMEMVTKPFAERTKRWLLESGQLTREGEQIVARMPSQEGALRGLGRFLTTPQHFFRKDAALSEFAQDAMLSEVKLKAWVGELRDRGFRDIRTRLATQQGKAAVTELDDIILGIDAVASEAKLAGRNFKDFSVEALVDLGYTRPAAEAYQEVRKTLNTVHRQLQLHRKTMRATYESRLKSVSKQLAADPGNVGLKADIDFLKSRIDASQVGYLEGYYPHRFIGGWRAVVNGQSVPKLYQSSSEALVSARRLTGGAAGQTIRVYPMVNDLPFASGVVMDRPQFFMLKNRVEQALGMSEQEAHKQLQGVARLRSRKKVFGHLLSRKGAEGFSADVEKVVDEYIANAQSYMISESLKHRGLNLLEGLPKGSQTRKAFESYLQDILRQKQSAEAEVDAVLFRLFESPGGKMVNEVLRAGENVPGLGALAKGARETMISDFPSRRIVNATLATTTHLKLGLGNFGSAVVNLSQVPLNVYPILGEKYTAIGYAKLLSEAGIGRRAETLRLLDRAGISMIAPKYETGVMMNRSVWEKISLGLFNGSERINQSVTFLGKYQQMLDSGHSVGEAFAGARELVMRTNFVYGPSTSPEVARKLFAKLPLQFRGFMIREMGFISGLRGKEIPRFLAALTGMTGIMGIPGVRALDAAVEAITGKSYLDEFRAHFLRRGETLHSQDPSWQGLATTVAAKGVPALLGVDFSERIGFGDFIPTRMTSLLGPSFDTAVQSFQTYQETGDPLAAAASIGALPAAALQAVRAIDEGGTVRSLKTGKVQARGLSPSELILRSINIPVSKATSERDVTEITARKGEREAKSFSKLTRQWARATRTGDFDAADEILDRILRVAERESIDGDRMRESLKRALTDLELSPTERVFKRGSKSSREFLGSEVLDEE